MRRLLFFLLGVFVFQTQLLAQKTITGKILDETGNPVVNASIQPKGGRGGTVSGSNGSYSITIANGVKSLVFSSVNFELQEVAIGSSNLMNITLKGSSGTLSEIVVTGYGTTKKADITGSIATVKAADIENLPFSSVDKALQGKVAGLQSVAASGQPGASQNIIIRGISTISGSSNPLWVIDGVPVNIGNEARLQTTSNLLSTLNPNDIESISVLKDAASQSIYGSRAANGVIVVTTKKGRAGKPIACSHRHGN